MTDKCPATMDVLAANVITAAEQQTMNYYMNTAALWPDEMGRRLYQEIGMVEEQHVTQYGSLLKPCMSRLENLLVHQYVECWLYWSCYETETDTRIRGIWQFMFEQELKHLHIALELLRQYEKRIGRRSSRTLSSRLLLCLRAILSMSGVCLAVR